MATINQIADFVADNFASMKTTVLYSGSKVMNGTINLSDSVLNYDLIVFSMLTNVDYFSEFVFLDGFNGNLYMNNKYSFMKSATTSAGTTYSSTMAVQFNVSNPTSITATASYNNVNWILGIQKIVGVKFAGKHS